MSRRLCDPVLIDRLMSSKSELLLFRGLFYFLATIVVHQTMSRRTLDGSIGIICFMSLEYGQLLSFQIFGLQSARVYKEIKRD